MKIAIGVPRLDSLGYICDQISNLIQNPETNMYLEITEGEDCHYAIPGLPPDNQELWVVADLPHQALHDLHDALKDYNNNHPNDRALNLIAFESAHLVI